MKLRIRGNSLRLRLLRGEVAKIGAGEKIVETINFGASRLSYALQISSAVNQISATFDDCEITISLPKETGENWAKTNLISLEATQKISDTEELKIWVEKDFVCLDRPNDADNADAYPHI